MTRSGSSSNATTPCPPRHALVTGGAGFVGSALVRHLLTHGASVTVLDDFSTGRVANLPQGPQAQGLLRVVTGDVRVPADYREALAECDIVFHLACRNLRFSLRDPATTDAVNTGGTLALLSVVRRTRPRCLVHVSSSEVYGRVARAPIVEESVTRSTTAYVASKLAGESHVYAAGITDGLPVIVARPFNAYGPRCHHEGDSGEVIPRFILRALAGRPLPIFGNGEQTRDFTYVDDLAAMLCRLASTPAAVGKVVNLGSGKDIAIGELAQRVGRAVGRDIDVQYHPERPGDLPRLRADTTRACRLLGPLPATPLATGLARLVNWYRTSGCPPEQLLAQEQLNTWDTVADADT